MHVVYVGVVIIFCFINVSLCISNMGIPCKELPLIAAQTNR